MQKNAYLNCFLSNFVDASFGIFYGVINIQWKKARQ